MIKKKNLRLGNFVPSLWFEVLSIRAPDLFAVVHGIRRNTKHCFGWEVSAADFCSTCRDYSG
jgi:hypothetical protein